MLELIKFFLSIGLEILKYGSNNDFKNQTSQANEKKEFHLEFGWIKNIPRNFCTGVIFARSVL
jgi:hypothetical protein